MQEVVNTELILSDIKEIKARQKQNLAKIEEDAKEYAAKRGYDADMTKEFIEYAQSAEDFGLSKDDKIVLNVLNKYVRTVGVDMAAEAVEDGAADAEAVDGSTLY